MVFEGDALEIDIQEAKELSLELAGKVKGKPDLVVFVAKGSYLIGKTISEYFGVPLLEVYAKRSGGALKSKFRFVLRLLPHFVKVGLRKFEMRSGVHSKNTERDVFISDPNGLTSQNYEEILLVDDSVDTGHTIVSVRDSLKKLYPNATILIATFDVFEASKELVHTDYYLFENRVLSGPWSSDSKWHTEFLKQYETLKSEGAF